MAINTHALIKTVLLYILIAAPSLLMAQADTLQQVVPGRKNAMEQQQKPYVILISADGFRHDYAKKYNAEHLLALSKAGVRATSMIPSFPSVTFPNHYTLVTGLYPSHHGLVSNTFYDPGTNDKYSMGNSAKVRDGKWYGGTPLWVLAEQQGMIAASMFWVGSEAAIQGVRPTYYYNYTEKISADQKVKTVVDWLSLPEDKRPHLITFYLSEPDHAGHTYGPEAQQTIAAVKDVDETIFKLTEAVKATGLPVNFIFVSDHGMTAADREHPIRLPDVIDPAKFIVSFSSTMVDLHAVNKADIKPLYAQLKATQKNYQVYLKKDMPRKFHYGLRDDRMNRIGDILLVPEWPMVFSKGKVGMGYHGFDPTVVKDMHATFYAWGPLFKSGMQIDAFENVNVYPLVTEILGLKARHKIDGKKKVLKKIIKR